MNIHSEVIQGSVLGPLLFLNINGVTDILAVIVIANLLTIATTLCYKQ